MVYIYNCIMYKWCHFITSALRCLLFLDCRKNSNETCIPLAQINETAKSLNLKYVETSALTQHQIKYCFEVSVAIQSLLSFCCMCLKTAIFS